MQGGIGDEHRTAKRVRSPEVRHSNSGQGGAVRELERVYLRYKALTFAVAAGVLLRRVGSEVAEEADALVADARRCEVSHPELATQFAICVTAAEGLDKLVSHARDGENGISHDELEAVRRMHHRVRSAVWELLPCEYTPCSTRHATRLAAAR